MTSDLPGFEPLESRLLLSADLAQPLADDPYMDRGLDAVVADLVPASRTTAQAGTTLILETGEELTLDIAPEHLVDGADLSGVGFALRPGPNAPGTPQATGLITRGIFQNEKVSFEGEAALAAPFEFQSSSVKGRLAGGELSVKIEQSQFKDAEFSVRGEADITIPNSSGLHLAGAIKGKYENGLIDFSASLALQSPFAYRGGDVAVRLARGEVGVKVEASEFKSAELAGIQGELDVNIPNTNGLKLAGALRGRYENGKVDVLGTVSLLEPFQYRKGNISTRLNSGMLGVTIEGSEFKHAELTGVAVDVAVADANAAGPLKLKGTLSEGTYKPGEGITFNAKLEVTEDFIYEKGPVKATLKSGGFVQADVQANEFKPAEFLDIGIELAVRVPGASGPLKLKATLSNGAYKPGEGVTFNAKLEITDDFVYAKDPVKATLKSGGSVQVKVEANDLQGAAFRDVPAEVQVRVGDGGALLLGGSLDGKYENGLIDLAGRLSLAEDFTYTKGATTTRLEGGQSVGFVAFASGRSVVNLTGAAVEVDQDFHGKALKLAGRIRTGWIVNGSLNYRAQLRLREPFVVLDGRIRVLLVSARVDVIVVHGELRGILIRDPLFEIDRSAD